MRKMSVGKILLVFSLLVSLLLNIIGLYWAGDLAYRQITSHLDCQALQDKDFPATSYVYSDPTTWLMRVSDHDIFYIKRYGTNDVFSILKLTDLQDLHSAGTMQCMLRDLLAVWSYNDSGRCVRILLFKRGMGLFDKNGDGKFRKLSSSEIDKVSAAMVSNPFLRTDSQKCDAGNGGKKGN